MIILGIDTATKQLSCALGDKDGVISSFRVRVEKKHTEILMPSIEHLLKTTSHDWPDLAAVAVDVGPGLFSGLRVGVTIAKTIAEAVGVPMVTYSSLDLLSFPYHYSDRLVVSVMNAGRGEVFYALYKGLPRGMQRISPNNCSSPQELAAELFSRGEETLLVGEAAKRYSDIFIQDSRTEIAPAEGCYPSAARLVELSYPRVVREDFVPPEEVKPLYLKKSDAEINWEKRNIASPSSSSPKIPFWKLT